jgi:HK97 family phage portal protein
MWNPFREKLNPAQPMINEIVVPSSERTQSYEMYYETLEVVNRGVNMITDDVSEIKSIVGEPTPVSAVVKGIKRSRVNKVINYQPNPYQDISAFRRGLVMDFLLEGNIFIYFDGVHMYHLPASKVFIHGSDKTYVSKYTFNEVVNYSPDEIIHIKENSYRSIYRGVPRLKSALKTLQLLQKMKSFQDNFFENGAVPGLVIKSPNTLSPKIKERLIESWMMKYNPDNGGRRPLILDGGLDLDAITNFNFKDLDFQNGISDNEKIVLKALGVPPIMLDSGNNANLSPNMRMYYLECIIPIVRKINTAFERYFGYHVTEDITDVTSLQPELSEQSQYYTGLVNGGIITANEAREKLGFCKADDCDEIRIPQNIAGSAVDPSEGGRPTESEEE